MRHALTLAARGLGNVWPNPAVGCVIVTPDGEIAGRGWTQAGGRPHAETEALREAGARAKGATAYVTLEPCAHHGKTPPCATALAEAGIARAVIALDDPDPRVDGRGCDILNAAGIDVIRGVLEAEARAVNAGFLLKVTESRPLVTLKFATSMDGRTATASGESQWITGDAARQTGHRLRAAHDAILVGAGTAAADNPSLTCRLAGLEGRSPVRVVLDSRGALSPELVLATTAKDVPTWLVTSEGGTEFARALAKMGVDVFTVRTDAEGRLDIAAVLALLAGRGITRLLVEGGATVSTAFLAARVVDRIAWFRAGGIIGSDGLAALGSLGVEALSDAQDFRLAGVRRVGDDLLETYERAL